MQNKGKGNFLKEKRLSQKTF